MKKLVFSICKQFNIKFGRSQTHYLNCPSAKNQYLNMKNIICCPAYIDHILLACTIFIDPCSWVCFDKRMVTSTQTLLFRSALSLGQRPSNQTFPKPNSTQIHVSGFEAARPQQGHWAIVVVVDWKYRTPIRKTSRSERPHFTLMPFSQKFHN